MIIVHSPHDQPMMFHESQETYLNLRMPRSNRSAIWQDRSRVVKQTVLASAHPQSVGQAVVDAHGELLAETNS